MMLGEHGLVDNAAFWAFLGVVAMQVTAVVLLVINRNNHSVTQSSLNRLEAHVNNVEVDIDHSADDVTLGQRVKRIEQRQAQILRILED